jgi:integrase
MNKATVTPAIDRTHPRKDGTCSIYIRVTFQRKKKEYPTGITMKPAAYDRIMKAQRRKQDELKQYSKIMAFFTKALDIIEALPVFTFAQFEDLYLSNTEAADTIKTGFERHIQELKDQKRIGSAVSYETAINSIEGFKAGLRYADITVNFLNKYEAAMLKEGKSKATIGIYLRSLRAIMNRADIDRKLYPFGNKKNKYAIPTGHNIKKALTLDEISRIFSYNAEAGTTKAMAKDYWIFIYLCNGLNVKDLCLLKWKNIDGDWLRYERAKTSRTKKDGKLISVSLKPEAKAIISRWGLPSLSPDTFIFPHLSKGMTPEREREIYQQLTKTINKYVKLIAKELKINKEVTTYFARHSFATILKNSGASTEFISEALGHSGTKTTQNYLAGFEQEAIHKATEALTAFAK